MLKVRFEVASSDAGSVSSIDGMGNGESEISMDSIEMIDPLENGLLPKFSGNGNGDLKTNGNGDVKTNGNGNGYVPVTPSPAEEEPTTPVLRPMRAPRTPPSVRVVDAFGREHVDLSKGEDSSISRDVISPMLLIPGPGPSSSPPGNKSRNSSVRIVDAMGRHVEEESFVSDTGVVLTREEAYERIRDRVSRLARDMSDADL